MANHNLSMGNWVDSTACAHEQNIWKNKAIFRLLFMANHNYNMAICIHTITLDAPFI
jgi:hypothetical protein